MKAASLKNALFISFVAAVLCCSCTRAPRYVTLSGYAQGGTYAVKINLRGVSTPQASIAAGVDSILTLIDTTLSGYNKGSMLSRFNAGEDIVPNDLFVSVYAYAREMFQKTGGALDVAAGPLFDLWGFGFTTDSLPSDDTIAKTLANCGMARLKDSMQGVTNGSQLLLEEGGALPKLNYNAIAQGLTSDMVAQYLYSLGVKDMLVDIGEIYCDGLNASGNGWTIGVDRPVDGNDTPGADMTGIWQSDGSGCGIVTSGNYRKFYVKDGHKYSHTIDPRTGRPVEHNLLSATIICSKAEDADALATYCMVIGLDQAKEFILSQSGIEGYLIYSDATGSMQFWNSPGFNISSAQ